ncbi:MAG TPA: alpha/beta fold hydrolase [Kiritimatiellia bacterium]|nr:alpha/beta fold hydrolase [Kiritimatiellia bacterium]HRZ12984.1 alpha/beta fold hydrolase [Kiritimatiellia bacterium]HSA18406.1 alpha/beta fold hydrolase [Kiritimatiellia bacterium]
MKEAPRFLRAGWMLCWLLLGATAALQVAAWNHARAFLRFQHRGASPTPIESLGARDKVRLLFRGAAKPRPENRRAPADVGLTAETVRFSAADGTGLEAWFVNAPGDKPPVLFFHGYASARSSLLDEAAMARDLGHPVLLVDFRGSGGSDGNSTTLGYLEALDVKAAVSWIRTRLPGRPACFLYGQSMGAAAVLRAVTIHDVAAGGLVLEAVFDTMLNAVRNRFKAMGWPAFPAAESLVLWGGVQCGFNGFRLNPADYARSVKIPTLVLYGDRDLRLTLKQARRVFDRLAGPRLMVEFPRASHSSCLASDPARWRDTMSRFLSGEATP